jgi:hypothetical protein
VSRVTEHAVKAIEAKGFNFTQTMMDNSEHIARLISEASETATGSVNQSLKELQTSHIAATETTGEAVNRSIRELREAAELATQSARRRSPARSRSCRTRPKRRRAVQAVRLGRGLRDPRDAEHAAVGYDRALRALREANILLQEVLSGAHENMSDIESTLVARVSDFVAAMNDVAQKAGSANSDVERNIASFKSMSLETLNDLSQLAGQFDTHGRSLAERWR